MASNLANRIDRLTAKFPGVTAAPPARVIRIVASDGEEAEALALAKAEGFDPDISDDIVIIRLICPGPFDQVKEVVPARVMWRSD